MPSHSPGVKRKLRSDIKLDVSMAGKKRYCRSLVVDSGAHSLYNENILGKKGDSRWIWYKTDEFKAYLDRYAKFIKKNGDAFDFYVTVDVIYNPQMSWDSLKYLEEVHGLNPVPVIHARTPLKWVEKHLEAGYPLLGIGGLGQESTRFGYTQWADRLFSMLCPPPKRLPIVKTHGFAMSSYSLMLRYPWYSVDSASAFKVGGFGSIFVPHRRNGKFIFDIEPYNIGVSYRSEHAKDKGKHYITLSRTEQKIIDQWLEEIEIPFGKVDKKGNMVEFGVSSCYPARGIANLKFFERMVNWLPKYPWPFRLNPRRGFFQ